MRLPGTDRSSDGCVRSITSSESTSVSDLTSVPSRSTQSGGCSSPGTGLLALVWGNSSPRRGLLLAQCKWKRNAGRVIRTVGAFTVKPMNLTYYIVSLLRQTYPPFEFLIKNQNCERPQGPQPITGAQPSSRLARVEGGMGELSGTEPLASSLRTRRPPS